MKKLLLLLCMTTSITALTSCGSSKNALSLTQLSGEWNIIEIEGQSVVPAPGQTFPFIGFDTTNGKIHGNSGCNRLLGGFDVNAQPGTINLQGVGSTRMMCPDMKIEDGILKTLSQITRYKKIDKANIGLYGSSKKPLLVLQKKEAENGLENLDGKWMIKEVEGQTIKESQETTPFITFDINNRRMNGNAGCNIINGALKIDKNNPKAIAFGQVISTMMACPDMDTESKILKALSKVSSHGALAGGGRGLYDSENNLLVVLKR